MYHNFGRSSVKQRMVFFYFFFLSREIRDLVSVRRTIHLSIYMIISYYNHDHYYSGRYYLFFFFYDGDGESGGTGEEERRLVENVVVKYIFAFEDPLSVFRTIHLR